MKCKTRLRMGIFHRDLKPQNILISTSDNQFEVKLIDFGTATVTAFAEAGQTAQSTSLVGTPAYMSPDCLLMRVEQMKKVRPDVRIVIDRPDEDLR